MSTRVHLRDDVCICCRNRNIMRHISHTDHLFNGTFWSDDYGGYLQEVEKTFNWMICNGLCDAPDSTDDFLEIAETMAVEMFKEYNAPTTN